ncbi:DUF6492 family protein [Niveispirillum cyanobacteriorum]|uniref:Uncharacterized protein n=1 Tax=Niveispirillum cyanobacteriorum TaxID=1612173 RepID=A0A2K9NNP1_9PROT|nr:DUF6492 family protein [Niveispirillum cyanobacteriorum]AUN33965.1 hypothetical protein C0V82_26590 [Niveispirillum cyanobacteriorum]
MDSAFGFNSKIIDVVISVDAAEMVNIQSLIAMTDSLICNWSSQEKLSITVVHRGGISDTVRALFVDAKQFACRFLSFEEDFGVTEEDERIKTKWRRILALIYPPRATAPFFMMLDASAFCLRMCDLHTLLPDGRALTQWERMDLHPSATRTSFQLLGGGPLLEFGLSVHPAIYSRELAGNVIKTLEERHQQPVLSLLLALCRQDVDWTDNSLYSLVNWARLTEFHMSMHEQLEQSIALHSDINLWSDELDNNWSPKIWTKLAKHGVFLILHPTSEKTLAEALDRSYCALHSWSRLTG